MNDSTNSFEYNPPKPKRTLACKDKTYTYGEAWFPVMDDIIERHSLDKIAQMSEREFVAEWNVSMANILPEN